MFFEAGFPKESFGANVAAEWLFFFAVDDLMFQHVASFRESHFAGFADE